MEIAHAAGHPMWVNGSYLSGLLSVVSVRWDTVAKDERSWARRPQVVVVSVFFLRSVHNCS